MMLCAGCERPILDRFLLNVLDRAWHVQCVQCFDCSCILTDKCFSRDGKLFCRTDFFRRYGTKCAGCSLGISPSDLVRRARNKVFHLNCFTCMVCRKQLSTGEELYILDENKFICKEDYINSKLQGSDVEDEDFDNTLENQESISEKEFGLDNDINHLDDKTALLSNMPTNDNANMLNNNSTLNKSDLSTNSSLNSPAPVKDEPMSDSCPSPPSPESQLINNINPGSNCSSLEANDTNNNKDSAVSEKSGGKRRGPRTTIKAKQLEVLKAAFNATPKPTRHIREQLAQETGLNMRVIQVWFQNRRSKERRMKQLSALGARRHFFRSPRRMRALRAGMSPNELDESEMLGPGFGYFGDNGQEFYPGYQGYNDFFPGQVPEGPPGMNFLPPSSRGTPPMGMEHLHPVALDGQFMPGDMLPPSVSPEPLQMHPDDQYGLPGPPRSVSGTFPILAHHPEVTADGW